MPHCETFMCSRSPRSGVQRAEIGWNFSETQRTQDFRSVYCNLFLDSLPKLRSMINLRRRPTVILNPTYFFYFNYCPIFSADQTSAGNFQLSSVSQPSFNWLPSCWVFRTGQRTSVLFVGLVFADWWCRATTTDILQCGVNKRIFQQSICVACVYVGNLLAESRQEW